MNDYMTVTLCIKVGHDGVLARIHTLDRLNAWFTDRSLGGFNGEPAEPGALLHYSVPDTLKGSKPLP